jgi:hypothetical protein
MEPSNLDIYFEGVTYVEGNTDVTNAKKQVLERLLKIPENRQNGVLQPGDFDLLRLVYQKPLWDMGKDLAQKLMEGSNQTGFMNPDVTLGTSELIELTALIQKKNDPSYAIRFSPLKLRQIETDMERQRIRAIKVTAVKCRQLGQKMPDNITFKFILVGKSVVRSSKRLFAFDPDMKRGKNKEESPVGVTFGTYAHGTKSTAHPNDPGWNVLEKEALERISDTPSTPGGSQESLLTTLMNDNHYAYSPEERGTHSQFIKLSRLRPGIFSDFLLRVTFSPAGSKVEFKQISVEIELETADTDHTSVFVSVDNNLDLEIPITASISDHSGRDGGFRHYVGLYDEVQIKPGRFMSSRRNRPSRQARQ